MDFIELVEKGKIDTFTDKNWQIYLFDVFYRL